jgi:hypothetical protein
VGSDNTLLIEMLCHEFPSVSAKGDSKRRIVDQSAYSGGEPAEVSWGTENPADTILHSVDGPRGGIGHHRNCGCLGLKGRIWKSLPYGREDEDVNLLEKARDVRCPSGDFDSGGCGKSLFEVDGSGVRRVCATGNDQSQAWAIPAEFHDKIREDSGALVGVETAHETDDRSALAQGTPGGSEAGQINTDA